LGIGGDTFAMSWAERDGPPVSAPKRRGFGEKAAKQEAEDVKLLEQLLTATNGSYSRNGTFADLRAIKVMPASVPLETVVNIVKWKVNLLS
jgi:hypothetical protein